MQKTPVSRLIEGLRAIPDAEFECDNVYQLLSDSPIEVDSIAPFFHWSANFYTRNLIYKDARFELMAVCWEPGQVSRVHNHAGQSCWMTVPVGKLLGQNFAISEIDETRGYCKLVETDTFDLSDCLAAKVELEEPVHQMLNLEEFDERAVSLHIYSKPFDTCLSYCRDTNTFKEVPLFYTSVNGKLCDGIRL
ncbi:MAG: cysteine dioxygenase family protein [Acidobacteriota bacterium]|nr:cysteine dioxygenase family protein [Blastocatellia bacterium]MDQ3219453.1 cysteine dioxygenase family protein [Acidobacteriota bacterium]MDQ3490484.1 cysteine dioxygenase family protein [Acidobacteriota bacterium]